MPCLTRSALIKRSPKPMHLTDRNLLQKTAPESSKHTRLPACKPFLQCKQTGIHLKHWQGIYTKCNPKKKKKFNLLEVWFFSSSSEPGKIQVFSIHVIIFSMQNNFCILEESHNSICSFIMAQDYIALPFLINQILLILFNTVLTIATKTSRLMENHTS